jgi:hypothetical protein
MIVRKAVHMAQIVGVPILGVVENMAYFVCPDTGKRHFIFGPSHANEVALLAGSPVLASLPIDPVIAAFCDIGNVEAISLEEVSPLVSAFIEAVPVAHSLQR